jgi:hypothetical protein
MNNERQGGEFWPINAKTLKKLSAFCTAEGYCHVHKSPSLEHVMSYLNRLSNFTLFFSMIRFNIILPSTPSIPKWSPPSRMSAWNFYAFLNDHMRATWPTIPCSLFYYINKAWYFVKSTNYKAASFNLSSLHGVTCQKSIIFIFTSMRTSNLIY